MHLWLHNASQLINLYLDSFADGWSRLNAIELYSNLVLQHLVDELVVGFAVADDCMVAVVLFVFVSPANERKWFKRYELKRKR